MFSCLLLADWLREFKLLSSQYFGTHDLAWQNLFSSLHFNQFLFLWLDFSWQCLAEHATLAQAVSLALCSTRCFIWSVSKGKSKLWIWHGKTVDVCELTLAFNFIDWKKKRHFEIFTGCLISQWWKSTIWLVEFWIDWNS